MKPVALHSEVRREFTAAATRYEQERDGLGTEFRHEFEAAIQRIRENPSLYAVAFGNRRLCPIHRFAYSIVYVDFEDRIWIAAVAHQHRRKYWRKRQPE